MRCRIGIVWVAAALLAAPAAAQMSSYGGAPAAGQAGVSTGGQAAGPPSTSPFLGSVPPKGDVTSQPLPLSLKDAVQRALDHNLGLLLQEQTAEIARGARWHALSELLPNLSANLTATRQIINLQAYGFPANPPLVGPFNVFDARVAVSQPVIDLAAMNDAHAAEYDVKAAQYGIKDARDLVVLVAVNAYLESLAASSRFESTRAQLDTAQALFQQAQDLKTNGLVAGIDVVRSQVQLQVQRQRVIAAQNSYQKSLLQLSRAIGIPVGQPITLTDTIPYAPTPELTLDAALERAYSTRPDYLAAQNRLEAAQSSARAASAALLPTFHVDANYGVIGQTPADALRTYALSANVKVPLFDAGSTHARQIQQSALLRQRQAELSDFHGRVEYEVRSAFLDVKAAEEQLLAARTNQELANEELQQARDRFAAGVASNLEVTQAQESVAAASDTYIAALYTHNLAKATLARALGVTESAVMSYLGGKQ
ncbi:MAG TPA: TolC family protein [Vicinamibacterales bacterium]|jgi:outer membrane protein TolC|nr:TolC family protein [Vicinamibacterales bacterium]